MTATMEPPKGGRLSRRKDVKLKPGRKPVPTGEHTPEATRIRADVGRHAADLAVAGTWPSYSAVAKVAGLTSAVVKSHRDVLESARDDFERRHGKNAYRHGRAAKNAAPAVADDVHVAESEDGDSADGTALTAAHAVTTNNSTPEPVNEDSPSCDARTILAEQRTERLMREKGEDAAAIAELKRQVRERDELVRRLMLPKRPPLPRYTLDDAEFK